MNEFLAKIIDAHGGIDRWNGYDPRNADGVDRHQRCPVRPIEQDVTAVRRDEVS